jgi:hypothetical protein
MASTTSIHVPPPRDLFAQGIGDEIVREKTGRGWGEWHSILETRGGQEEDFTETVRYLSGEHDLSTWWACTVAAHYRRERGLRR